MTRTPTPDAIDQLPTILREALRLELDEGERLLWCARPLARRIFRSAWRTAIPASLVFLLFASLGLVAAITTRREVLDSVPPGQAPPSLGAVRSAFALSSAFGLAALACLASPAWQRARARRTVYALTNTRLLVLRRGCRNTARTEVLEPSHPLNLARRDYPDGSGDIRMYPQSPNQPPKLLLAAVVGPREIERTPSQAPPRAKIAGRRVHPPAGAETVPHASSQSHWITYSSVFYLVPVVVMNHVRTRRRFCLSDPRCCR